MKTIKEIKIYETECCKICGELVNQDDGWCFNCGNIPTTTSEKMIKISDLRKEIIEGVWESREIGGHTGDVPIKRGWTFDDIDDFIRYFFCINEVYMINSRKKPVKKEQDEDE